MTQQEKYSVHAVEMVRNNGIAESRHNDSDCFFMFDYFDVLYHKELTGRSKNYENYLSIQDPFDCYQNYKVSYKVLSLYQLQGGRLEKPFGAYKGEGLSETPFLGVIQITLCKESYKDSGKVKDISGFLCDCEDHILKIVGSQLCKSATGTVAAKQLYRSSTTGDFCLVLRTDSVEMIYRIALALNSVGQKEKQGIRLFTYTSVGIECKLDQSGEYCTLSTQFVEKHPDMMFALRFSAPDQLEGRLKRCVNPAGTVRKVSGLFGRYDYLLNIDTAQFAEIYPVLCEKKLGVPVRKKEWKETDDECGLAAVIRRSVARNINERILVNLSGQSSEEEICRSLEQEDGESVILENKAMYQEIMQLDRWRKYFAEEHREFQELFRCMKEMCRAFLPAGMEKDAYVNWVVFRHDMQVLCRCINLEMKKYAESTDYNEAEKRKERRIRFLKSWRQNIQAINQYTRLVQNVNYQTYQSPIYEIQTQIDTEKAMVAYREAMEYYMYLYAKEPAARGDSPRDGILTLIYPDMSLERVEVRAPFAFKMNVGMLERHIVCTVPSFEYFGRLYDMLPWIIHECSHHIRILSRKKRNRFIAEDIFRHIFRMVMSGVFMKASDDVMYGNIGLWGECLIESMVEVAKEEVFAGMGSRQDDFEHLTDRLAHYLSELFEIKYSFQEEIEDLKENRQERNQKIVRALLDAGRLSGAVDERYLECVKKAKENKSMSAVQEIAGMLLECYRQQLQDALRYAGSEIVLLEEDVIQLKELLLPIDELDKRLWKKMGSIGKILGTTDALKEYCFSVKQLYRIHKKCKILYQREGKSENGQAFWEKVFDRYQKKHQKLTAAKKAEEEMLADPSTIFVMRNMGLLNGDKKVFCDNMQKWTHEINGEDIQNMKIFRVRIYREICADLLMTISLQMSSFGYCRQAFQTISDTKIGTGEELYSGVNFERFRVVTAVLLKKEGAFECRPDRGCAEEVCVDAGSLIEQSKKYCENTLRCIRESLYESTGFKEDEEKRRLLNRFLGTMNRQLKDYLGHPAEENYQKSMLYFLLHEKGMVMEPEVRKQWKTYQSILPDMIFSHYQFRRLECLCRGIRKIVYNDGCVVAPKGMFDHVCEIWDDATRGNDKGCFWEKDLPEELLVAKRRVGEFYNEPEQVYTLKSSAKLENTIDFIQNYYYNNRFRVMEIMSDGER